MVKNTGKPSEHVWDEHWARFGKLVFNWKIEDAAALFGLNKKVVNSATKPCDRILTNCGQTSWCEIKSTTDENRFAFKLIRKGQINAAVQVVAAGGTYVFYVHSLFLNKWFLVPWQTVEKAKAKGKASILWRDLDANVVQIVGQPE